MNWIEIVTIGFVCGLSLISCAWSYWYFADKHTKSALRQEIKTLEELCFNRGALLDEKNEKIDRLEALLYPTKNTAIKLPDVNNEILKALTQRLVAECILDKRVDVWDEHQLAAMRKVIVDVVLEAQKREPISIYAGVTDQNLIRVLNVQIPRATISVTNL